MADQSGYMNMLRRLAVTEIGTVSADSYQHSYSTHEKFLARLTSCLGRVSQHLNFAAAWDVYELLESFEFLCARRVARPRVGAALGHDFGPTNPEIRARN